MGWIDDHEHKPIRINEMTLSVLKMDEDVWAAFQEAWARCQLAPYPKASGIIIEAVNEQKAKRGLNRSQCGLLRAYLEAED